MKPRKPASHKRPDSVKSQQKHCKINSSEQFNDKRLGYDKTCVHAKNSSCRCGSKLRHTTRCIQLHSVAFLLHVVCLLLQDAWFLTPRFPSLKSGRRRLGRTHWKIFVTRVDWCGLCAQSIVGYVTDVWSILITTVPILTTVLASETGECLSLGWRYWHVRI